MREVGVLGGHSSWPGTPGLQQLSQVSGLCASPCWTPALEQVLGQLLLQPLPWSLGVVLSGKVGHPGEPVLVPLAVPAQVQAQLHGMVFKE